MYSLQAFLAAIILSLSVARGTGISDSHLVAADGIKKDIISGEVHTDVRQKAAFDGLSLAEIVRATRRATFVDQININMFAAPDIAASGARISYANGNNNNGQNPFAVQATETIIVVTQTSFDARLGSVSYNDGFPPGWNALFAQVNGDPNGVHRRHLGPPRLGGSGLDVRNIVAMYQLVSVRHLAIWERMVNAAFDENLVPEPTKIRYRCRAVYDEAGRDSPSHIRTTAWLLRNDVTVLWFDVTIPNEKDLPGAAATIHFDATARLFPSLDNRERP